MSTEEYTAVADILGLEAPSGDAQWHITDFDKKNGLYNVHYDYASVSTHGKYRGYVVDVPNKTVVAKSFPHIPTVTLDKLPESLGILKDDNGVEYNLTGKKHSIFRGHEGTLIKVYLHHGRLYISTHRMIYTDQNVHRDGPEFQKLFLDTWPGKFSNRREVIDTIRSSLYPKDAKYSPHVHMFILLHPDLNMVSKVSPSKKLVYLGHITCPWENVPEGYSDVLMEPETTTSHNTIGIYKPTPVDVKTANRFLSTGFFKDVQSPYPELKPGEFLVIYVYGENDTLETLLRVQSQSYAWRSSVRGYSSLYNRMFSLLDECNESNLENYKKKYFSLQYYPESSLREMIKRGLIYFDKLGLSELGPRNRKERFHNAVENLILAVSNNQQAQVLNAYHQFLITRKTLEDRLYATLLSGSTTLEGRVSQLMTMIRNRISVKDSDEQEVKRVIHKLMLNEYGGSLKSLVKYYKM